MRAQEKEPTTSAENDARARVIVCVSRAEKKALKRRALDEDTTVSSIVRRALKLAEAV